MTHPLPGCVADVVGGLAPGWLRLRELDGHPTRLIGATTAEKGLRVRADLDSESYPTKVMVKDEELASVDLHPHHFHGEWNYTIKHQKITE